MGKNFVSFCVLSVFFGIVFINPAFSGMECVGTTYNGVYYKKGQHYYPIKNGVKYDCIACGSCVPISGTQSSSMPTGRLSPSQQMAVGVVAGLFNGIFSHMFDDIFTPPDPSRQEELARQHEEERRKLEEMKRQALEAWQKARKEMEAEMARQDALRKEAGQQILAQNRIDEDVKLEPSLFETHQAKLEASSISSGYPAPKSELDKARCAAYFSELAKNTKDMEGIKFLSLQAEKVMQGAPTDYPCQFEKMPEVPVPQETYAKNEEVEAVINIYQAKIEEFEEIQTKINEIRKQKLEAETKLKEADTKINVLQAKSTTISKPEERTQLDDLLSQAMAAKQEAENDLNTAKQDEQKYLDTARQKADEIRAIDDQISGLEKGNK